MLAVNVILFRSIAIELKRGVPRLNLIAKKTKGVNITFALKKKLGQTRGGGGGGGGDGGDPDDEDDHDDGSKDIEYKESKKKTNTD